MGTTQRQHRQDLALSLAAAWGRLERMLDSPLAGTRGISFAEYRILRALADAPSMRASRVDLARAVGLTASGVTRALRPLEKLKVVTTERSERDARLALATLTDAGQELVSDASEVVNDVMTTLMKQAPSKPETLVDLVGVLTVPQ